VALAAVVMVAVNILVLRLRLALQIQVVAQGVVLVQVHLLAVQALSFFATPAQFNISLVAQ